MDNNETASLLFPSLPFPFLPFPSLRLQLLNTLSVSLRAAFSYSSSLRPGLKSLESRVALCHEMATRRTRGTRRERILKHRLPPIERNGGKGGVSLIHEIPRASRVLDRPGTIDGVGMMYPGQELEGKKDGSRKFLKSEFPSRDSNWSTTLPVDGP